MNFFLLTVAKSPKPSLKVSPWNPVRPELYLVNGKRNTKVNVVQLLLACIGHQLLSNIGSCVLFSWAYLYLLWMGMRLCRGMGILLWRGMGIRLWMGMRLCMMYCDAKRFRASGLMSRNLDCDLAT